jgi:hypothetical protein
MKALTFYLLNFVLAGTTNSNPNRSTDNSNAAQVEELPPLVYPPGTNTIVELVNVVATPVVTQNFAQAAAAPAACETVPENFNPVVIKQGYQGYPPGTIATPVVTQNFAQATAAPTGDYNFLVTNSGSLAEISVVAIYAISLLLL